MGDSIEKIILIPKLIIEYLIKNGANFISSLPDYEYCTLNDIIKYCIQEGIKFNRTDIDFQMLVTEAISNAYDKKYFYHKNDERIKNKNIFINTFFNILNQLGINEIYKKQNVIVVGIGNGNEGRLIYDKIKYLTIIDIASDSLKQAQSIFPHATAYKLNASNLYLFDKSIYDLYISLRTYQSTYFDILKSLKEAKRILRTKGLIIISIPCGYFNNNELISGMYNPHNGILEKERPDTFIEKIIHDLKEIDFKIIGLNKIPTEIFIYAEKN